MSSRFDGRPAPTAVDLASIVGAVAGWNVSYLQAGRANGFVLVTFYIDRTGGNITGGTGGDIPNETLCTDIPALYRPIRDIGWSATVGGVTGCFGLIRPNGQLLLTALSAANSVIGASGGPYLTGSAMFPAA